MKVWRLLIPFLDPNEYTVQALTTALDIEFGKNFTYAWDKFKVICEKYVNAPQMPMTRMYMIILLISCNASHPPMSSRIFGNIFNGFLEKLQIQDVPIITKDLMSFLNFLVSKVMPGSWKENLQINCVKVFQKRYYTFL